MNQEVFFDNNATTKPLEAVRDAMMQVLGDRFGNPSSSHVTGDRGREFLSEARRSLGQLLGGDADCLVFTSGGTESNNLVLSSAAAKARSGRCRIVTTTIEHSSVLKTVEHLQGRGAEVVVVPVGLDGIIDLDQLDREVTPTTSLVSVQWVNNETGVVQPVEHIGRICRERGVPFHSDACQAAGKLPIRASEMPVDLLTLTAHKIHGPQGAGAVWARDPNWLVPMLYGGPQESSLRAGTENLPGIVGFGRAATIRQHDFTVVVERLRRLRDTFEQKVSEIVADVAINGDGERRVCNTSNLRFQGIDGQALVARLDQAGIRCSQSSACTNQRPEPSYVLRAMGLSEEEAYSSVRFSFGVFNTEPEIEIAATAIRDAYQQLRNFSARLRNPYHAAGT